MKALVALGLVCVALCAQACKGNASEAAEASPADAPRSPAAAPAAAPAPAASPTPSSAAPAAAPSAAIGATSSELPELPAPPDVAKPPPDAQQTTSGIWHKPLVPGDGGKQPVPGDWVSVYYTGWTADGERFDSAVRRGRPDVFQMDRVIPGWTTAIGLLTVGEKRRFWIPQTLSWNGAPGRPAGTLCFDMELVHNFGPDPKNVKDVPPLRPAK